ncbi:MAG: hypothetical protein IJ698_03055 [Prevotella sp.]|nr:hypothetical protein [Prevotella sp.]
MNIFFRQSILLTLIIGLNDVSIAQSLNGHEYVDLGLPSGTLWATCNVGATTPEESGDFYAWGETETKTNYSWETYKWCDGTKPSSTNASLTKYCDRGAYGALDGKISLELKDDVAHVKWGGEWHIPTIEEFHELLDNCTFEWIKLNSGNHAYKITGRNGNILIMPAAGYFNGANFSADEFNYWSANLMMKDIPSNNHATNAWMIDYDTKDKAGTGGYSRFRGFAVRPVLSKYRPATHTIYGAPSAYLDHELVDLGLPTGTLWAKCNLGASSPEGSGCYYSWGEITGSCDGKTSFGFSDYTTDYTDLLEPGETLDSKYDAAAKKWGGEWRMPTLSELRELQKNQYTTWEWTTINGVNGYRITSIVKGFEGNNIFLPAAGIYEGSFRKAGEQGNYWSSTLYGDHDVANNVGYIYFNSTKTSWWEEEPWYGLSIRPVVSFDKIVIPIVNPDPDVILGDANGDGKVTVADYTAIAHYILGKTPANFNEKAADVNGDGKINVADYTAAAHLILYGTVEKPK